jgi:WXXGXW repeat (2 copies)
MSRLRLTKSLIALTCAAAMLGGCYVESGPPPATEAVVEAPPPEPAPPAEAPPPPAPSPMHVWIRGHYRWGGARYVWIRGHYERRPRASARYVYGHWEGRARGKVWVHGHWD